MERNIHRTGAHVYVMHDAQLGRTKVGYSSYLDKRSQEIKGKSNKHRTLEYWTEITTDAFWVEGRAHELLQNYAVGNEWFDIGPREAISAVHAAILDVEQGWRYPKGRRFGGRHQKNLLDRR